MTTPATSETDNFFRWQASSEAPSVALSRSVMCSIKESVLSTYEPRGAETSGILLGYRDSESGEFVIEAFERVPGEYGANIVAWRARVSSRFLGIYRSQARPGLAVSPQDCALVESLLPRTEGVLMLVKALSPTDCVGTFFLCDGGAIVDEATAHREFPFGDSVKQRVATGRARWLRILLPSTAVAAGILVAVFTRGNRENPNGENPIAASDQAIAVLNAPEPAPIALHTLGTTGTIRLLWNADSASIRDAPSALLTVLDGDQTSSIHLKEVDLKKGSMEWKPKSRNVNFRMTVNRANSAPLIESARMTSPEDSINSSSASPVPKPSEIANASAATGEQAPLAEARSPRIRPRGKRPHMQVVGRRQPSCVKRVFGGITSKASHLWPFHSGKQD